MPDAENKLTAVQQDKIRKWLTDREALRGCPICGNNQWTIADSLVLAPLYVPNGITLGAGFPAAIVLCSRCTFFRFHSAIAMGIVPKQDDAAVESEATKHGA